MRYPLKPLLLSGLLIGSSQALAFDPNAALRQQEAQQQAQHQAQQVRDEQALYERYRNKEIETARINNDGTVTIDNLQWMRCSLGQQWNGTTCTGNATTHNWNDASALPELMNAQGGFAGHSDWRLPTISELASLRVCSSGSAIGTLNLTGVITFNLCSGNYSSPTLDTRLFPGTSSSVVCSGSPDADYSDSALNLYFGSGLANSFPRHYSGQVRLVRSGQ